MIVLGRTEILVGLMTFNRWRTVNGLFRALLLVVSLSSALASFVAPAAAQKAGEAKPGEKSKTAQDPPAAASAGTEAAPASWLVSCTDRAQGNLVCEMTQIVVEQNSGRQLMLVSVKSASDGGASVMLFRLLHGVYLPSGITVSVDGAGASPLPFQKSDQFGVYAALPLTDKLVAELKKGKSIVVHAEINKGEPLDITALLNGFGPALDKVKAVK